MDMETLFAAILPVAFGGALLVYLAGKLSRALRDVVAVLSAAATLVLVAVLYGQDVWLHYYSLSFLGIELALRADALAWFFAMAVAAIGLLSIVFSLRYMQGRGRLDFYYLAMLVVNAAMLGIVFSADLVSLFAFWEVMSWSTFLLISYRGGKAVAAGLKYIIMSIIGSCAMLLAIASLYATCGTLDIRVLMQELSAGSAGYSLFILLLFTVAFAIKNAVVPLHTWLPDAYTEADSPFAAVLSGMLTRMGVYGFLLILFVIMGCKSVLALKLSWVVDYHYILSWLGALTIVIPTFIALLQDDAKKLLAWHGIGQGGYMILGIAFGTSMGVAGGIFHTLNHATYIVLLFMVVGAVEYRTGGVRDLNKLGGLAKRMPVTFIGGFMGIAGLIGIPLTNGFVSKWLIYKTLVVEGFPFLAFAALIGTWGTVLSVFKFLHNIFLGQLPERYKDVREVPLSMQLPMILLSLTVFAFGVLPGIPLRAIAAIQESFGTAGLHVTMSGVPPEVGELDMINILTGVAVCFAVVYAIFAAAKKARRVDQFDSYGAGSYVPADRYQYSVNFYQRAYEFIRPYVRDRADDFYRWLVAKAEGFFEEARKIYTGNVNSYVAYIVILLALLILLKMGGQL
jgi:formate hydrogenlyase subunit 3/multisubunit Na+/H+ antiporter MnhD subunit